MSAGDIHDLPAVTSDQRQHEISRDCCGKLTLSSATSKYGTITDTIPADGDYHEPVQFRAPYLADVLSVIADDDFVLRFAKIGAHGVIESGSLLCLVVPVKMEGQ